MHVKYALFLVVAASIPTLAAAEDPHFWQPTMETARRTAAQTNRLVLVYFCADWCQACRAMEHEVFTQPNVVADLQTNFAAVKVNADYFPSTAKQYGITALPTTVITTADGQAVEKLRGRFEPAQYVARLNQVAIDAKRQGAAYAQIAGGAANLGGVPPLASPASQPGYPSPTGAPQGENRPINPPGSQATPPAQPPDASRDLAPPPAAGQPPVVPPGYTPPLAAGRSEVPPMASADKPPVAQQPGDTAAGNPPLALDGYCPVQLSEKHQWAMGDRRWGVIHRGRTYLFSGPEERNRFFADPDRYAPVLSGNDVVLAIDYGQAVSGCRDHGLFFENKVYLFSSEESLQRFCQNAPRYAQQALQTAQIADQGRQRLP